MTIFINGRFLAQKVSGVQRFACEIVKALDKRLQVEADAADRQWVLLAPRDAHWDLDLARIECRVEGNRTGHAWEQLDLYWPSRQGFLINLCNSGPILHSHSLTIIHDAMVFRTPGNFSRAYGLFHRTLDRVQAIRSQIGTVSDFSRRELIDVLKLKSAFVVPNSCEHMAAVSPSPHVLGRLGVDAGRYFVFVGSPTPNKNLSVMLAAMKLLGQDSPKFVIVGASEAAVFGTHADIKDDRIIFAGRLPDEDVVALYRGAIALVFPSVYEGFGIPPLEAMLNGCPVIASDIPPVREVCGDSALYVNPKAPEDLAAALRRIMEDDNLRASLVCRGSERAAGFSWDRSVSALLDAIPTHRSDFGQAAKRAFRFGWD